MERKYRVVCGHCLRTFIATLPEESEFCWECGNSLVYIGGDDIIQDGKVYVPEIKGNDA